MSKRTSFEQGLREAEEELQEFETELVNIDQRRLIVATEIDDRKRIVEWFRGKIAALPAEAVVKISPKTETASDSADEAKSLRKKVRDHFEHNKEFFLSSDLVKSLSLQAQAGTVRTAVNTLYNGGELGRVHVKGVIHKYAWLEWLKKTDFVYDTHATDPEKPKKKATPQT